MSNESDIARDGVNLHARAIEVSATALVRGVVKNLPFAHLNKDVHTEVIVHIGSVQVPVIVELSETQARTLDTRTSVFVTIESHQSNENTPAFKLTSLRLASSSDYLSIQNPQYYAEWSARWNA